MIDDFDNYRKNYLSKKWNNISLTPDSIDECNKYLMKKELDYAFSKTFYDQYKEEKLLEMHPALKDLHDQYQVMLALLKKEEKS